MRVLFFMLFAALLVFQGAQLAESAMDQASHPYAVYAGQ